ncbi:hypothetical protein IMZ48_21465 [Candidatus Bathyarchaeota archaeon]|nr:hypothetical protein [Candidatus Bathyarchaeota archaeon]
MKALSSKLKSTTLADNEEISSDETSGSSSDETSSDESSDEEEFQRHLKYLKRCPDEDSRKEIALSPIFTSAVRRYARDCEDADRKDNKPIFPQHALLGCEADADPEVTDRRLYYVCAFPDDERTTSCIVYFN